MLNQNTVPLDLKGLTAEGEFEGYASTFGNMDNGGDVVERGAFGKTLEKLPIARVKMLFQHDPNQIIGKWLEAKEDRRGLWVKGKLNLAVQRAKEILALLQDGAIDGMSIGFRTVKASREDKLGAPRKLLEVDLWEISLVTFPMNDRSLVANVKEDWTKRDVERVLREAGAPNEFAKLVATKGYDEATRLLSRSRRDDGQEFIDQLNKLTQAMKG